MPKSKGKNTNTQKQNNYKFATYKVSPNIHAMSNSQNHIGNINSNYNCESEIGTLKSKMERFADNVTNKLEDLASEIHNIKENKLYSIVVLENVIDELKKEKLDLCKANADIRKENINMKNIIADLSLTNKNLKNVKLINSLTDYNQLTVKENASDIEVLPGYK